MFLYDCASAILVEIYSQLYRIFPLGSFAMPRTNGFLSLSARVIMKVESTIHFNDKG